MLGLELRDGSVLAVAVDDGGKVRARAEAASSSADLGRAAFDVLDRTASARGDDAALGVASMAPESAATLAALEALSRRYPTASDRAGLTASGTAAAIAEAWTGAARGARDVVFFSVADHASAGIVRDGIPVTGAHGRAPAVAWLALNPVEREDYRKTGCLESEVAAAGIVRRLVWRIKAGDESRARDMANGELSAITLTQIFEAARQSDGVSLSVVRDTVKYLGMAAANLVAVADPDILVVGGMMALAADLFLEPLRSEVARRLPAAMMPAIVAAALGADAAAIGAARLGARAGK